MEMEDNGLQVKDDINESHCDDASMENDSGITMEETIENVSIKVEAATCISNKVNDSINDFKENCSGHNDDHCSQKDFKREIEDTESSSLGNWNMCSEFTLDQNLEENFTDLDLICVDGYVQVHRCLLMGASEWLRNLLIDKDIMDTTAITLPDVTVRHLKQVLNLIYFGESIIYSSDEKEVYQVMTMLQLPINELMWKRMNSNNRDGFAAELRHVPSNFDFLTTCTKDKSVAERKLETMSFNQDLSNDRGATTAKESDGTKSSSTIKENQVGSLHLSKKDTTVPSNRDSDGESCASHKSVNNENDDKIFFNKNKSLSESSKRKLEEESEQDQLATTTGITNRLRTCAKGFQTNKMQMSAKKQAVKKLKGAKKKIVKKKSKKLCGGKTVKDAELKSGECSGTMAISNTIDYQNDEKIGIVIDKAKSGPPQDINLKRRLSNSSSISCRSNESKSGTSTNRVFLKVKEISGVKYNIYGLLDPTKGVQSGKTIAILASTDKSHITRRDSES